MNAGAYLSEIKDIIFSSESVNKYGEIINLSKEQMKFSYRKSIFLENKNILMSGIFELTKSDSSKIVLKMENNLKKRKDSQPLSFPNAGSTFKRPKNNFASKLIDDCGLKGVKVGGAMVSTKHAGFVVNIGGAKCDDVLELTKIIRKTVLEKAGVLLDLEINYWD